MNGLLLVTMQPAASLPAAQFHDWYNNEHGPLRLRLPFIPSGFRYRATDLDGDGDGDGNRGNDRPEWLAIYDVTDMSELTRPPYTTLREPGVKSRRETQTMAQITVDRRLYDLIDDHRIDGFRPPEAADAPSAAGSVLVAVYSTVHPGREDELDRWYREEHIPLLSKVPGWRRTRRFVTSSVLKDAEREYLALHEYDPQNGLGGPEWQASVSTPWTRSVNADVVRAKRRRTYTWFYTFGPAPRELGALTGETAPFTSPDGRTKTVPSTTRPAVESYLTTPDGVDIPYRLEGSSDPDGPVIVLSNSILVDWGIWDGFVDAFLSDPAHRRFRVLRYLTRGRLPRCGTRPITLDVLSDDLIALLDALRIPRAALLVGVSLGGATVLNAALRYPARVGAFVSCDTNAASPAGNRKAWGERAAIAEAEKAVSPVSGEAIVGSQLAEATVRRWFVPTSYDGGALEGKIGRVKAMVETNSLAGFKRSVQALFAYDLREQMKVSRTRGLFVVGAGDGVLPGTMREMAAMHGAEVGGGAELKVIDHAGHLPMVEQPERFAEVVVQFLSGRASGGAE
ncbi:hypothetical protein VTN00DRAFT_3283 [Thermoascus crustaceus]|uniref:uncharacterized protein n=1 Tax=Thermoascus crustaceus TaxID=5088 RepID=UPI003743F818